MNSHKMGYQCFRSSFAFNNIPEWASLSTTNADIPNPPGLLGPFNLSKRAAELKGPDSYGKDSHHQPVQG